jgi:isocitrate/isopropylmalate dehydrogenase
VIHPSDFTTKLLVLPGDGIGPEITAATLAVLWNDAYARAAQTIEAAIDGVLQDPATRTRDLGGQLGTRAFAERVAGQLS